jgi:hypothetical protein
VTEKGQVVVGDNQDKDLWLKMFDADGDLVASASFPALLQAYPVYAGCGTVADIGPSGSTSNDFSVLCTQSGEGVSLRVDGDTFRLSNSLFQAEAPESSTTLDEFASFLPKANPNMVGVTYREVSDICDGDGHPYLAWSRGRARVGLLERPVDLMALAGCPTGPVRTAADNAAEEMAVLVGETILIFTWNNTNYAPILVDTLQAPALPAKSSYTDISFTSGQIVLAQQRASDHSYLFLMDRETGEVTSNHAVHDALAADWMFHDGHYGAWYSGQNLDRDYVLSEVSVTY